MDMNIRQIRSSVFETNSSSVHSLVINEGGLEKSNLIINPKTNKVLVRLQYFGKEAQLYTTQLEKLTYLVTFIAADAIYNNRAINIKDYAFASLNKIISEYANCKGIEIENLNDPSCEWGFDHQTAPENEGCIVNLWDVNAMKNFIFNKYISLKTDWD